MNETFTNKFLLKTIFTGITPTGNLTIGHYCSIIKNLLEIQQTKEYHIVIMIADLHAFTTFDKDKDINYIKQSEKIASLLYSSGLKDKFCTIFIQSDIKEHLELMYILSSFITVNKLKNMIQYKEKKKINSEGDSLSLFSYPVLMCSDILLYKPDIVIVGKDQKQHIELSSFLANKLNNLFDYTIFKNTKYTIPELGAKILDLKNPSKKMSKSDKNSLSLLDSKEEIEKKIKESLTDCENKIYFDLNNKPGISNLLIIYSVFSSKNITDLEIEFKYESYSFFKEKLINLIWEKFSIIQNKFEKIHIDIKNKLDENSESLKKIAKENISVFKKLLKIN